VEQSFPIEVGPHETAEVALWLSVPTVGPFEAQPVIFVDERGAHGIPVTVRGRGR